jgi:hypothetical protein
VRHPTFGALAFIVLLPLAACGSSNPPLGDSGNDAAAARSTDEPHASFIATEIQKGMQQAKQELATKNIEINHVAVHIHGNRHDDDDHDSNDHNSDDTRPKAEITPQGDLLIAGKKVAATPAQQTLLMNYRQQIIGIADAGMDIGSRGADLGISAAKQAVWGALSGKSDKDIDAAIKPQTDKIEAAAAQLCKRLPDMLTAQQNLAAAMPEFRPYATMQHKDIDDCGKNTKDKDGKKGFAVFSD